MANCKNCGNREICANQDSVQCDRYDVAYTRSEIISMFMNTEAGNRGKFAQAVERAYKLKMAF